MEQTLTIGMAHHNDFSGTYFTIQDITKELAFNNRPDLLNKIKFLIVENDPESQHAVELQHLARNNHRVEIVTLDEERGTSPARNKIIEESSTDFVLVMDCHVLLCPVVRTLDSLFQFMEHNPNTEDLYQGPLVYDSFSSFSTHFNNSWGAEMWGQWGQAFDCSCEAYKFSVTRENVIKNAKCKFVDIATQEQITKCPYCQNDFPQDLLFAGHQQALLKNECKLTDLRHYAAPFEIFAQGLGLFFTRKNSWLGFNEHQRGFGGEECYIHEKYRQAGRKTMCLPFLKWLHRFGRPDGPKYEINTIRKLKNYLFEFVELGLDLEPLKKHYTEESGVDEAKFRLLLSEARSAYGQDNVYNPEEKDIIQQIEDLRKQLVDIKNT
tara:strand:- start:397 stop:1536 length:1140 start_codon:yes stop_codon:yes gene_type:complete